MFRAGLQRLETPSVTPHATRNPLSIGLTAAQYGPARQRLGRICSSCYCFLFCMVSFVGFFRAGLPPCERVRYLRAACPCQSQGDADSRRRLFPCEKDFIWLHMSVPGVQAPVKWPREGAPQDKATVEVPVLTVVSAVQSLQATKLTSISCSFKYNSLRFKDACREFCREFSLHSDAVPHCNRDHSSRNSLPRTSECSHHRGEQQKQKNISVTKRPQP